MREEAKSRLQFRQLPPWVLCTSFRVQERIEGVAQKTFRLSTFGQRPARVLLQIRVSKAPHGRKNLMHMFYV